MSDKATILDFNSCIEYVSDNLAGFSKPFFNGIFIIDADGGIGSHGDYYYGDEIDFVFWELLNITIGEITDDEPTHTYEDGYKYIYNYTKRIFKIYDDADELIYNKEDIESIADMHIDFTVIGSHDFVVVMDYRDGKPFLLPAKFEQGNFSGNAINPSAYVNNNCVNDSRVEFESRIADNNIIDYSELSIPTSRRFYELEKPSAIKCLDMDLSTSNDVYRSGFKPFNAIGTKQAVANIIKVSMLFDVINITMHPTLQPIVRPGELHNNRPVYEPWMIWGAFRLLYLSRSEEEEIDPYPIEVFDLSPNWSY